MADLIFEVDYSDLQKAEEAVKKLGRASKDQARLMEQGYRQLVSWQQRFAAEQGRANAALEKSHQAQQLSNKSARDSARAFEEHAKTVERLRREYQQGYTTFTQARDEMRRLKQAQDAGIITTDRYRQEIVQLRQEYAAFTTQAEGVTAANNRFAQQMLRGNTRSMNAMGMATQQAGYQIGDFLVQVQSGTNWMVAFGQQATQLVGVLPMMAEQFGMNVNRLIGISTVLGIAIPLMTAIGAAIMRTRESSNEAEKSVSDVSEAIDQLSESTKRAGLNADMLAKGLRSIAQVTVVSEIENLEKQINSVDLAIRDKIKEIQENNQFQTGDEDEAAQQALLNNLIKAGTAGLRERRDELKKLLDENKTAIAQEEEQNRKKQAFLDKLEKQVEIEKAIRAGNEAVAQSQTTLNQATTDYINKMADAFTKAQDLREELGEAAYEALRLAGVDMTSGVDAAAKAAATLAANMGISLAAAQGLVALGATPDNKFMQLYNSGAFGGTPNVSGYQNPEYANLLDRINNPSAYSSSGGGGGGGGVNPIEQAEEYLQKLQREAEFKSTLIGLSDEQVAQETRREQLLNQLNGYEEGLGNQYSERIEQIIQMEAETRKLTEAEQQREQLMQTVTSNIESAFMSVVDGSKSVEDAFKSMLRNIILAIYQEKVAKAGANAIMSLLGLANGGAFERGGKFTAYANGGVVGSPTMFSHSGGLGVMGEAGPEAIMPLKRGKNGKLGVQMEGSSQPVVVNNNFNIAANGDESVKRIIRGEVPRITEATKSAVLDAKRRGGSYGRAF